MTATTKKTSPRWVLVVEGGGSVWTDGRMGFAAGKSVRHTMRATTHESASSQANRERIRAKATKDIGKPCRWERDGFAEYIDVVF
jgi:hypothetical protein